MIPGTTATEATMAAVGVAIMAELPERAITARVPSTVLVALSTAGRIPMPAAPLAVRVLVPSAPVSLELAAAALSA